MQHKWHKEIKAWADGAEIEAFVGREWHPCKYPAWDNNSEYRIKPQPKEPQYLYVYQSNSNDYIFDIGLTEYPRINPNLWTKIGKIKLEVDD
jgi:hypothetical protein